MLQACSRMLLPVQQAQAAKVAVIAQNSSQMERSRSPCRPHRGEGDPEEHQEEEEEESEEEEELQQDTEGAESNGIDWHRSSRPPKA